MNSGNSAAIYTVAPSRKWRQCEVETIWTGSKGVDIGADYNSFCALAGPHANRLCAGSAADRTIDIYTLSVKHPGLEKSASTEVDAAYDMVRSFTVAGAPWVVGYEKTSGAIDFFRVEKDLSLTSVYRYMRTYGDVTTGFTTIEPFAYRGDMRLLAYCAEDGRVGIHRMAVTADAPLLVSPLWSDTWAQGWTRFSLFRLGAENFFLKTNTKYKSVYIDHLAADADSGSHPVGRHLPLPIDLTATATFEMDGDVYIGTYRTDGAATLSRLHTDCQGWGEAGHFTAIESAGNMIPLEADGTACLFVY
jgi:hypothetical protein